MINEALRSTIADLTISGKGILAADESTPTITKRFESINAESSEESRRQYRELLFTTEGLSEFISGVILFEETLGQSTKDGTRFVDFLSRQSIVAGIKVDKGLVKISHATDEKVTQGLDGLADRLASFKLQGARFAKWRAVFNISPTTPTSLAMEFNAENLARYAAICQDQDIVPIVEPEILMDGDHSIERCFEVTEHVLHTVFHALRRHRVALEYIVLKPNMVLPGKDNAIQADATTIAQATVQVLRRAVPCAVPTINFLSGGQSAEDATLNLNAMNALSDNPWQLSFSYGRALQAPALKAWAGTSANAQLSQNALYKRAKLNHAAILGEFQPSMEADY